MKLLPPVVGDVAHKPHEFFISGVFCVGGIREKQEIAELVGNSQRVETEGVPRGIADPVIEKSAGILRILNLGLPIREKVDGPFRQELGGGGDFQGKGLLLKGFIDPFH